MCCGIRRRDEAPNARRAAATRSRTSSYVAAASFQLQGSAEKYEEGCQTISIMIRSGSSNEIV